MSQLSVLLHEIQDMRFLDAKEEAEKAVSRCRMNFKRMQRQVKKEMKLTAVKKESHAQETARLVLEQGAKQKRQKQSRSEREAETKARFKLKQEKKKAKKKGH